MLFDLLPHFARLMPMADKFLATRSASEKAQEAALTAMDGNLRGELGKVAESHAGIQRTLKEQGAQVAAVAVEVTRARMGVESVEARVAKLEQTASLAMRLLAVGLMMLSGAMALLAIVLLHLSRR
jgi:hypothetical protein